MTKKKMRKLRLNAPNGIKVKRFNIGGESQEARFVIQTVGFYKLVGVSRHNKFTWIHKDFAISG